MSTHYLIMCINENDFVPYCVYVGTDINDVTTQLATIMTNIISDAVILYPDCTFSSISTGDSQKAIVIKQKSFIESCDICGVYNDELVTITNRQSVYKKYFITCCVNQ